MTKKAVIPETPIRILKVGTCPSLSGRSTLTYHLGSDADGGFHCRVVQNSGSGQFNADWVSTEDIRQRLAQHPAEKPLTSAVLHPLFRGRSSNSPAFLFAALKEERLVVPSTEKDGGYLAGDIEAFRKALAVLIATGTDLNASPATPPESTEPTEPPKKKRPAKASAVTSENA